MNNNEDLISEFYTCFQKLDHRGMNGCYSHNIVFSDPIFLLLKEKQVLCMWEMLCLNAADFSLSFSDIKAVDHEYYTCKWTATYTYQKTGRKVTNHVKAFMRITDGKIAEHSDAYRLSTWIGQALGLPGILFGWMGWMKRQVQKNARTKLISFIEHTNAI